MPQITLCHRINCYGQCCVKDVRFPTYLSPKVKVFTTLQGRTRHLDATCSTLKGRATVTLSQYLGDLNAAALCARCGSLEPHQDFIRARASLATPIKKFLELERVITGRPNPDQHRDLLRLKESITKRTFPMLAPAAAEVTDRLDRLVARTSDTWLPPAVSLEVIETSVHAEIYRERESLPAWQRATEWCPPSLLEDAWRWWRLDQDAPEKSCSFTEQRDLLNDLRAEWSKEEERRLADMGPTYLVVLVHGYSGEPREVSLLKGSALAALPKSECFPGGGTLVAVPRTVARYLARTNAPVRSLGECPEANARVIETMLGIWDKEDFPSLRLALQSALALET